MKYLITFLLVCSFDVSAFSQSQEIQKGKSHPFVCCDYTQGKVFEVNRKGKITWEYNARNCNDIWILPNGNYLFNTGKGVTEVTKDKRIVFNYQSASEIYACQRLENGNTFIGECNSGKLLEVAPDGKIVKEINLLPKGTDGGSGYMRNARKLENGHFLVAHYRLEVVREYDSEGKMVREISAPGGPHSVIQLKNGNILIACADRNGGPQIIEVDLAGKIVWQIKNGDLPEIGLKFMTGLQRLPNGNTVITNWLGHNNYGKAPHIIEITPDKKVVWTFSDFTNMKTVSSIQLLDVKGNSVKGEIFH
jgi:hypothetical protein